MADHHSGGCVAARIAIRLRAVAIWAHTFVRIENSSGGRVATHIAIRLGAVAVRTHIRSNSNQRV